MPTFEDLSQLSVDRPANPFAGLRTGISPAEKRAFENRAALTASAGTLGVQERIKRRLANRNLGGGGLQQKQLLQADLAGTANKQAALTSAALKLGREEREGEFRKAAGSAGFLQNQQRFDLDVLSRQDRLAQLQDTAGHRDLLFQYQKDREELGGELAAERLRFNRETRGTAIDEENRRYWDSLGYDRGTQDFLKSIFLEDRAISTQDRQRILGLLNNPRQAPGGIRAF